MNEQLHRKMNDIPDDWEHRCIQEVVYGNKGEDCGTGVAEISDWRESIIW